MAWGRLGEICGQYLNKGKQVFIEGRIQSRDWEDQDGNKRTTYEIVASDVLMLGDRGAPDEDLSYRDRGSGRQPSQGKGRDSHPSDRGSGQSDRRSGGGRGDKKPATEDGPYGPPPPEDDIPF